MGNTSGLGFGGSDGGGGGGDGDGDGGGGDGGVRHTSGPPALEPDPRDGHKSSASAGWPMATIATTKHPIIDNRDDGI